MRSLRGERPTTQSLNWLAKALLVLTVAALPSAVEGQLSDQPAQQADTSIQIAASSSKPAEPASKPKPSQPEASTMSAPEESGGAPPGTFSVEAFQTDLFTGAATAQIPIAVPAGAAGVAPKIVLRYNSSTVDELQARQQGQSTGLGWGLDVGGFILRDTKNTTGTSDDTFKLVFGGVAYDLVLIDGAQSLYHTKDETFLKLQYSSASDAWTLTTKDGAQHRFGFNTDSKAVTRGQDLTTAITYKYLLDQVMTTSGVAVQYTYTKQTGTIASNGQTYDQAVYPTAISWAYAGGGALIGAAREVLFTWGQRTDWTDTSATTYMSFFERNRLDSIEVRVGGSLVRRYVLGFDYSTDRDPTYTWGGGAAGDLTLRTVTIYGADGTSALPALSFAYTNARLSSVNNGIGGTISFSYERVKATTALYRAIPRIQDDVNWYCGTGYYLSLSPDPSCGGDLLGYLVDSAVAGTSAALYRAVPFVRIDEFTNACGSGYYLSLAPDPNCGGDLLGYLVDSAGAGTSAALYRAVPLVQWDEFTYVCGSGYYLSLGPNPTCGGTLLGYLYAGSFDRSRVTARSVSDGRGGTSTLTFTYVGLGLSSDGTEFRGHASVRATDPLGHYTDTWFKQDDLMKGRPYHTQTRSSSGTLLAETTSAWATTSPYPGVTFVKLTQTDVAACDDAGGGCKQARQSFEYDAYGNQTRVYQWGDTAVNGDERDEYTEWSVDPATWLHRPTHTALYDAGGVLLRERWLAYDGRGLLTREERRLAGAQGSAGNPVVTSAYDGYGNRVTTTDPRGCTTTTTYDPSDQTYPASVTTCLGHTTTFAFDARWGQRTSETDPNNQTTTYAYDAFGRLTTVTGPLDGSSLYGSMTRFYVDFGNPGAQRVLTYRTVQHGTATVIWSDAYFDGLGRTYLSRSQGPGGQTIQSETTYDSRGLVATQSAPHFASESAVVTQFTYDARGRQIQALYPDGTSVGTAYAPGLVTVTDQRGNVKRRYQDIYGRLIRVDEVNGGETYVTTYVYDAVGVLVRVTDHFDHVTTLSYDLLGRKVAMSDPNMGNWVYGYDLAGNLLSQTDAKNQTVTFTYDLHGRVLTKSYSGGAQIQWTYDNPAVAYSKGRVTRIADLATVTTFAYDKLGRVTQTQRVLDSATYTMAQTWNALGKVTNQTFPDGETVTSTYNEAGWLASVASNWSGSLITSISYNGRGQQTQVQYANGVTTTWTYNPANFRVTTRATSGGPSGQLQNFAYAYDPGGNLTQITDGVFTGSRTYTYDAVNRLTSASGAFGSGQGQVTEDYRYDAIGNLLEKAGVLYSYSDPLHPSAVTARSDGPAYTYDASGNMLNGAGRALTWDADNRLTAVTIQGGNSAEFAYDAGGIRVRKTAAAGVTRYPFAGYEIDPYGVVTKTFAGIAKKSSGAVLFYHNDHLGGVHVITDASGTRVQLVEYDPWGQVSRSEGSADPTHRFTGQELDPETGLYYYGGRYYDAVLARFISADPFVPAPGNPQALNRYSYVLNSPANFIDPSGYFFGGLFDFFKKIFEIHWEVFKVIAPIAVGIVVGVAVTYATGNPIIGGMVGGAVAGALGAGLNGGDVGQSILLGAAFGGIGGAVAPGMGGALGKALGNQAAGWIATGAILGGAFGGISAAIQGGDVLQGIAFGAVTGAVVSAAVYAAYAGYQDVGYAEGGPVTCSNCVDPNVAPYGDNPTFSPGDIVAGGRETSGYGWRFNPGTGQWEFHGGADVSFGGARLAQSAALRAPAGGLVTEIGSARGYGHYIDFIPEGSSITVRFGHVVPAEGIRVNMTVSKGQVIGALGRFGTIRGGLNVHVEVFQEGLRFSPAHVMR